MDAISKTIDQMAAALQQHLPLVFMLTVGLWVIHIVNWATHYRLNQFGILPRTRRGLVGIIFSPVLHGDFGHLLFNSLPFFVLTALVLMQGQLRFIHVTLMIVILSGLMTWAFGRRAIHIGASGLVLGYMGYLFANAYYERSLMAIVLVAVMVYYFGALLINLLPVDEESSWEGHVFGFMSGLATAHYFIHY